jgi:hypothetical protein
MRKMTKSSSTEPHIANSIAKDAAEELKAVIRSRLCKYPSDSLHIIPEGAVASCIEKISEAAPKLASEAHFKDVKPRVRPDQENFLNEEPHHVITIQG